MKTHREFPKGAWIILAIAAIAIIISAYKAGYYNGCERASFAGDCYKVDRPDIDPGDSDRF